MGKIYKKQPFSADELLQKIENKGLIIPSKTNAINSLRSIGYYRLSSCFLAFKNVNAEGKPFHNRTPFENILALYSFDKELRLLVLDPIETIEIALRILNLGFQQYLKSIQISQSKGWDLY